MSMKAPGSLAKIRILIALSFIFFFVVGLDVVYASTFIGLDAGQLNVVFEVLLFVAILILAVLFHNRKKGTATKEYVDLLRQLTPSALFTVDTEQRITSWNDRAEKMIGYKAEEIIGKKCFEFAIHPCKTRCGLFSKEVPKPIIGKECIIMTKNKKKCYALKNAELLRDKKGRVIGGIESLEDISELKRVEATLADKNAFMSNVVESLSHPFSVIDAEDYSIKMANTAAQKENASAVGMKCYELSHGLPEPCAGQHECPLEKVKILKKTVVVEHLHEAKNGEKQYVEVHGYPIFNATGDVVQMIEYTLDITSRKLFEKKLQEAMDSKSRFTSMVSHELRTPLTAMRESINIVLDGSTGELNDEQKDFLDTAKRNVDRLSRLINDVLDFQKLELGRMNFNLKTHNINDVVEEVYKTMKPVIEQKGLSFNLCLMEGENQIKFDRDKIVQVLTNLINNSFKFTQKGSITLSTKLGDSKGVIVSVEDTGPGISEENLPRLFKSFEQFGDINERKGGTGLGLAISKEIVESHSGNIWAESKVGVGTKFIFTIPNIGLENELEGIVSGKFVDPEKVYLLFLIKQTNYADFVRLNGQERVAKVFLGLREHLADIVRSEDFIKESEKDEMILFLNIRRDNLDMIISRIRRVVKDLAYSSEGQHKIDFAFGYSIYPDSSKDVKECLVKARQDIAEEKLKRLTKKIMVVDDDKSVVQLLRSMLEKIGYSNLDCSYDGSEALAKINGTLPDLVILDMNMPKMNGYEVIGRLKGDVRTKDIPVLVLSGEQVKTDMIKNLLGKEAIPMIGKPFHLDELSRILEYML